MLNEFSLYNNVDDTRDAFCTLYEDKEFVTDKSGCNMLELIGHTFETTENHIFGRPNMKYISREEQWYLSRSRSVNDIPGEVPKIWQQVSDDNGMINSNYGWCLFSPENFSQFDHVSEALISKPDTRQAIAIYNRPNMHYDAFAQGRSDFMCTNAHQYLIRDGLLHTVVQMRSNDVTFGYRNDLAWARFAQNHLLDRLVKEGLDVKHRTDLRLLKMGKIFWQVGSLHIYERDFYLVDHYARTGESHISKKDYDEQYHSEDQEEHA